MANPEHLEILKRGWKVWNSWRERNRYITPDLTNADLTGAVLIRAYLVLSHLNGAKLVGANLNGANARGVDFIGANLQSAHCNGTDLQGANLQGANLREVDFGGANLSKVELHGADLSQARLYETIIGDTDLSGAKNLDACNHLAPCILDHRTLIKSGKLPLAFLRGCGLPDILINHIPSLLNDRNQFYSCFISYSSKNQFFADRLYADLQNKGVRCWLASEDLKIGERIRIRIDESIRYHDKLLLVLSKQSVESSWVEQEVETALNRERKEKRTILFPIRLDDTLMKIDTGWPALIKNTRNIGDFRKWKNPEAYQKAFDRLLRDLKAEAINSSR